MLDQPVAFQQIRHLLACRALGNRHRHLAVPFDEGKDVVADRDDHIRKIGRYNQHHDDVDRRLYEKGTAAQKVQHTLERAFFRPHLRLILVFRRRFLRRGFPVRRVRFLLRTAALDRVGGRYLSVERGQVRFDVERRLRGRCAQLGRVVKMRHDRAFRLRLGRLFVRGRRFLVLNVFGCVFFSVFLDDRKDLVVFALKGLFFVAHALLLSGSFGLFYRKIVIRTNTITSRKNAGER